MQNVENIEKYNINDPEGPTNPTENEEFIKEINTPRDRTRKTLSTRQQTLAEFILVKCSHLMPHRENRGPPDETPWSAGGSFTITYKGRIDSGAFGDVHRV